MTKRRTPVEIESASVQPAGALTRVDWYLHWLLCGEPLRVGEAVIRVGGGDKRSSQRRGGVQQLRIAIDAPSSVEIQRTQDGDAIHIARADSDTARDREAA